MNSLSSKNFTTRKTVFMLIAGVALLGASLSAYAATPGVAKAISKYGFSETVARLESGLSAHNLVILKTLNQQKMLAMVGTRIDKSKSILVINPKFGAKIYAAAPAAFIEIPFRILVQQHGNRVVVYYQKATALFQPYPGLHALGRHVTELMTQIVDKATH